ncbi:hypothetical protein Trydic_g10914 [Trypoxylus dichotomus]
MEKVNGDASIVINMATLRRIALNRIKKHGERQEYATTAHVSQLKLWTQGEKENKDEDELEEEGNESESSIYEPKVHEEQERVTEGRNTEFQTQEKDRHLQKISAEERNLST